ncbi:glycosyltransferase [Selenomonas ruminis]|uniref:Glycosyltransferase n=1 Tax=Selenomonas ruminis TaxID=2593411 RepID=A0A5D6WAY1_9FIRM|nr:glycosyltransferase [Selenomonas sp. mPRGC5]TYZ24155.1 glycosyltransferase [Selenomonas sp. mPRGC5]
MTEIEKMTAMLIDDIKNSRFEEALKNFERLDMNMSSDIGVLYLGARLYYRFHQYEKCESCVKKILHNYPDHYESNILYADLCIQKKEWGNAEKIFKQVIAKDNLSDKEKNSIKQKLEIVSHELGKLAIWQKNEENLKALKQIQKGKNYNTCQKNIALIRTRSEELWVSLEREELPVAYQSVIKFLKNVIYTCAKIKKENTKCQRYVDYELIPFCSELSVRLKYALGIETVEESFQKREHLFDNWQAKRKKDGHNKVSIILTAYNKLEYTKKAVESLFKYTDFSDGQAELITINNGSTDETEAYFESLPHKKKINLKYNILESGVGTYLLDAEYVVYFANDVIATPNWLENLTKCIESDEKIHWVVPTCPAQSISNLQGITIPYSNDFFGIDAIEGFARVYNQSDARKWEDRPLLMPFVAMAHVFEDSELNRWDRSYYQAEFLDDDYSTTLRRHGMRQVLARDTFLHHFGSITLSAAQRSNSSLENMRQVFQNKWGVDAWNSRGFYPGLEGYLPELHKEKIDVLMLNPLFGNAYCQIVNHYRKNGVRIDYAKALIQDERYRQDAIGLGMDIACQDNMEDLLANETRQYDIICSCEPLNDIIVHDVIGVLEKAYNLLKDNGIFIVPITNPSSTSCIIDWMIYEGPADLGRQVNTFHAIKIPDLQQALTQHPYLHRFRLNFISGQENVNLTNSLAEYIRSICPMDDHTFSALKNRLNNSKGDLILYR